MEAQGIEPAFFVIQTLSNRKARKTEYINSVGSLSLGSDTGDLYGCNGGWWIDDDYVKGWGTVSFSSVYIQKTYCRISSALFFLGREK
jgi:hypothetical protein